MLSDAAEQLARIESEYQMVVTALGYFINKLNQG